jgi:hypothetical protein
LSRRAIVVTIAVVAVGAVCAGLRARGRDDSGCPAAAFSTGGDEADGVFAALLKRGCDDDQVRACTVGDGHGPIDRETVPAGVRQDCFAFNQFIGSGLNAIPGYATGECFGRASIRIGTGEPIVRYPRRRCRLHGGSERGDSGRARPDRLDGAAVIDGRAPDPIGIPPQEGGMGEKPPPAPPWAVLVWRSRAGATCYEPGQVIGPQTRGLPDVITGVRPAGGGRLPAEIVGSLRPDAKSGTGIQIYGVGRFAPYERSQGGSCGDPAAGPGLLVSVEHLFARRDLGRARTIVAGVAGPKVSALTVTGPAGSRRLALAGRRAAFLTLYRGVVAPRRLTLRIRDRDGTTRRLALG